MAVPANVEGYYADPGRRGTAAYPGGYTSGSNTTYNPQSGAVTGPVGQGGAAGGSWNVDYPFYAYGGDETYTTTPNSHTGTGSTGFSPGLPPGRGGGRGGGGGGMAGGGGINWDAVYGLIGAASPGQYNYTPYEFTSAGPAQEYQFTAAGAPQQFQYQDAQWTNLNTPDYEGTGFYDFDTGQFDTARQGIQSGISDARQMGNTAFDLAAQRYLNYQDPYAGGPQTYNPGTDPRLLESMNAWGGAGSYDAAQVNQEGVQADGAMRSVYDLLGKVGMQFNEGQLAGIQGDRMQLDQSLGSQERMLTLGVEMALAKAKSLYEREKWQYGEEIARMNYEARREEALYNNQGINQMAMANNQGQNAAGMFNVGQANEVAMYNNQGQNQAGMYNVGQANEVAMYNNQGQNQAGMANAQGVNQANQYNVGNQNDLTQSLLGPLLELILSGEGEGINMDQLLAAFNQGGMAT